MSNSGCESCSKKARTSPHPDDVAIAAGISSLPALTNLDRSSVARFQELLRLKTLSGDVGVRNGSYKKAEALLTKWMGEVGLQNIREEHQGKENKILNIIM